MLIAAPARTRSVNTWAVNCTSWSVLNTSAVPAARVASSISQQNTPSRVFDSRQASNSRLYPSIGAVRYMKPAGRGISRLQNPA